jgi:hypothetical protein
MPDDLIRLGGYAWFLYLHGDKQKAFEIHLRLLGLEQEYGRTREIEKTSLILQTLGKHLGLSESEIARKINKRA